MFTVIAFLTISPLAIAGESIIVESYEDVKDFSIEIITSAVDFILPTPMPVMTPELRKEQECLAKNIYFEAKNEPLEGKLAVAQVTRNRVESEQYPDTYCAVVWQQTKNKKTGKRVAQFSWTLDGKPDTPRNLTAYEEALEIAERVLLHGETSDIIDSSVLFYHATYVRPNWSRRLERVAKIGLHIFYAPRG